MSRSVPAKTLVIFVCLLLSLSISRAQFTNLCEVVLATNLDVMQDTRYGASANESLTLPAGLSIEFVGLTPDSSSYILRNGGSYALSPVTGDLALPGGCTVAMWGAPPPNYRPLDEIMSETGITAWHDDGFMGAGVRVGVLDTRFDGLGTFIADSGLNAEQYIFIQPLDALMLERDESSGTEAFHGTKVIEVLTTIAPQAEYVIARAVNADEFGSAVDALISADVQIIVHAANVITPDPTPYHDAVRRAVAANILWVNSAGNIGAGYYPARYIGRFRGHQFADPNRDGLQSDLMVAVDPSRNVTISLVWQGQAGQPNPNDFALQVSPSCDPRAAIIGESDGNQSSELADPFEQVFLSAGELSQQMDYTTVPSAVERQTCAQHTDGVVDNEIHILVGDSGGTAQTDTPFDLYVEGAIPAEYDPDLSQSLDPVVLAPADLPEVLTVGAFDPVTNRMAWYSGRSNSLQYYALNNNQVDYSADERVKPEIVTYGELQLPSGRTFFGTSAATPIVAGSAALLMSYFSNESTENIRSILIHNIGCLDNGAVGQQLGFLRLSSPEFVNTVSNQLCDHYAWAADLSSGLIDSFQVPEVVELAQTASEQQNIAAARQIASEAENAILNSDYDLALQLSLQALENYPYTAQAERALARSLQNIHKIISVPIGDTAIGLSWSPNGLLVAVINSGTTVTIYNTQVWKIVGVVEMSQPLGRIIWSRDSSTLLLSTGTTQITVDNEGSGVVEIETYIHSVWTIAGETQIDLNPDMSLYALSSTWYPFEQVSVATLNRFPSLFGPFGGLYEYGDNPTINNLVESRDQRRVILTTRGGNLYFVDTDNGVPMFSSPGGGGSTTFLDAAWSQNNQFVAVTYSDEILVFDVTTQTLLSRIFVEELLSGEVTWNPSNETMAVLTRAGNLRIIELQPALSYVNLLDVPPIISGDSLSPINYLSTSLIPSLDGSKIAIPNDTGFNIVDANTGQLLFNVPLFGQLAWSPAGHFLFVLNGATNVGGSGIYLGGDGAVHIYETESGVEISTLGISGRFLFFAEWADNGASIITHDIQIQGGLGVGDETTRLWQLWTTPSELLGYAHLCCTPIEAQETTVGIIAGYGVSFGAGSGEYYFSINPEQEFACLDVEVAINDPNGGVIPNESIYFIGNDIGAVDKNDFLIVRWTEVQHRFDVGWAFDLDELISACPTIIRQVQ